MLLLLLVLMWVQFLLFPKHKNKQIKTVTAPPSELTTSVERPPLSSFHLFGSNQTSELALSALQIETSLDLIITGIFASDDSDLARAYIRNRQGDEKKFKIGEDVFGLAELAEVHEDHVVLSRNQKKEKLSLSKGHAISTKKTNKNNSMVRENASNRIANHIKSSSQWQEMLDQQKYDPNKIAQIVGNVSVVRDNQGQINGLRVSNLSSGNALIKQGLKRNDQIIAINGIDISSKNMLTLQSQLQNNDQANVTVLRNGRKLNVNLNLSEFQ